MITFQRTHNTEGFNFALPETDRKRFLGTNFNISNANLSYFVGLGRCGV